MAFVKQPDTWLANWSEDGVDITLPLLSLAPLSAADADGVSGDIRMIWYYLNETMWAAWNALASGDRPTKMTISKTVTPNPSANTQKELFANTFVLDVSAVTGAVVASE